MPNKDKKIIHVVSGTHWDREWRYTVEQSKLRLTHLIDGLLDILDNVPEYKSFILDGGTVVLEDYFSVRPENKDRLVNHVKNGRIQLVPWYTLPDNFLVCPEAIIRNLIWGKRTSEEWGGAMKSGYTATSYGQNSQIPQIYRGFGIKNIMFYRGTNKHQTPPICRWQGKDGSEIFLVRGFDEVTRTNWFFYVHYPIVLGKKPRDLSYNFRFEDQPLHMADDELYEMDFQITKEDPQFISDPEILKKGFQALKEQAYPQAIGEHVLALNMEDNALPYALLPKMIDEMNKVIDEAEIKQSTLDEYMDAVIETFEKQKDQFVHKGEWRFTAIEPGFNGLLGMTQSNRMKLKVLNERTETELISVAEPLSSLAAMFGWEYPRPILENAWKNLLWNHPHDSLCGAAVDQAHEDMIPRFTAARSTAREVTRKACEALWKKIDFSIFEPTDLTITVFNPSGFKRSGVQQVIVDIPCQVEIGGGVDPVTGVGAASSKKDQTNKAVSYQYFDILDDQGNLVPYELLSRESINMRIERELDTAVGFPAVRLRLLFNVDVDPLGYKTYVLRPRPPRYVYEPKAVGERGLIAQPGGILENEYLKVTVQPNGTFEMLDKATGRVFKNMHFFEDKGSCGSAHIEAYPVRDVTVTSLGCNARISVVENNSMRATIKIEIVMRIPAAATLDKRDRLSEMIDLPITTWITLKKGAKRVELRTKLDNKARDHRIRAMFPSYVKTNEVAVESAFAVEKRGILWWDTGDNMERFYPTQPMQNFIDLSDGKQGLAILNQGLREYEINDDPNRTIAITLIKTHRAYMVANENMIPEEFEKYTGLHCFGEHEFKYAVYPHSGDWKAGKVLQESYDFKIPYRIIQGVVKKGELAPTTSFVSWDNDSIAMSALCQSQDGKGFILRLWNSSEEPAKVNLKLNLPVKSVSKVRMDEAEIIENLEAANGELKLDFREAEIVTLKLT